MTPERRANDELVAALVRQGAVVADSPVHRAFRSVLRHWFLPGADLEEVYSDAAVVTHRRPDGVPISSSSQPAIMARMLRQLDVQPGQRVLEIGTGTGYNTALLAELVGPGGRVVTIDLEPEICSAAGGRIHDAGLANVSVIAGDGWTAVRGHGTFDRIEATVGVSDLSTHWVEQLEVDGTLVVPLWLRAGLQVSVAFRTTAGGLGSVSTDPCGFMRLRGTGAGHPAYVQIGAWTVSFDQPDPVRAAVVRQLLEGKPQTESAPPLTPGWFTPIALCHPDAIHLFSLGPEGPVVCFGILETSPPGLAVVRSGPGGADEVEVYGAHQTAERLLRLIRDEEPVELTGLSINAIPAGRPVNEQSALATLTRPNFSFVVEGPS